MVYDSKGTLAFIFFVSASCILPMDLTRRSLRTSLVEIPGAANFPDIGLLGKSCRLLGISGIPVIK